MSKNLRNKPKGKRSPTNRHHWTDAENQLMRELVEDHASAQEIRESFPTVTADAVAKKAKRTKTEVAVDETNSKGDQQGILFIDCVICEQCHVC